MTDPAKLYLCPECGHLEADEGNECSLCREPRVHQGTVEYAIDGRVVVEVCQPLGAEPEILVDGVRASKAIHMPPVAFKGGPEAWRSNMSPSYLNGMRKEISGKDDQTKGAYRSNGNVAEGRRYYYKGAPKRTH